MLKFVEKFFKGLQINEPIIWLNDTETDIEKVSYQTVRENLYKHFEKGWFQEIRCDSGWMNLIADCHEELYSLDPKYKIAQIKEKFGGLRFYCSTTNLSNAEKFRNVVNKYENLSLKVCEMSGQDGVLMKKNGIYKTLNRDLGLSLGYILTPEK